jgi:predicted PurR-regulated permease PerM
VFLAIHVTFDYVITPRVVGGSVGLHPIVNVFALMAGATLFGVWGMLLAVPVAASIQKLLLKFYPGLFVRDRSARPRTRGEEPSSAAT